MLQKYNLIALLIYSDDTCMQESLILFSFQEQYMTVFLALQEAFKAVPNPQATVKFCQRISPMLKDAPANYSGLRKEYEVRDINFFFHIQFQYCNCNISSQASQKKMFYNKQVKIYAILISQLCFICTSHQIQK